MQATEEHILIGCRKGKSKAQKKLYDLYSAQMFGVCLRYAKNTADAEDILQDGFVKVFKNIDKYDGSGPLAGWIYRVMVNTALNHLRSKNKMRFVEYDNNIADKHHEDDYIEPSFSKQEIMKAVQKLPYGYRTVFNMYVIDGYKHKEIAEMLDISINTSKTQLARARNMLKEELNNKKY